jgi:acid phosphatase class B
MPKVENLKGKDIVVFDIDGTIANLDHRLHFLPQGLHADYGNQDVDWEAYHEGCDKDAPITATMTLLRIFHNVPQIQVVFFTGRNELARDKTVQWLKDHKVDPVEFLFMRPDYNDQPNAHLKKIWLGMVKRAGGNVMFSFDDDPSVCRMYKENGVTCFKVNHANGETQIKRAFRRRW